MKTINKSLILLATLVTTQAFAAGAQDLTFDLSNIEGF